jgi:regulator of nucleoside diphosphate kinase
MERERIFITQNDLESLRNAIHEAENSGYRSSVYIKLLKEELDRATIVSPEEIPADVITMKSTVMLTDLDNREQMQLTLCYPQDARQEDHVSVLAPIGTAMLGYREGDEFVWDTPSGKAHLRVDKVLYQPEATGNFD